MRAGAPAESTGEDGRTALYAAAGEEPGIVRALLAAGADPDRPCGPDGDGLPLCAAAVWGHTRAVRALLAAGAAPDRPEPLGLIPMVRAVRQGRTETVETAGVRRRPRSARPRRRTAAGARAPPRLTLDGAAPTRTRRAARTTRRPARYGTSATNVCGRRLGGALPRRP
ncbi:ankyrin repeat domain-containing protein [Streptomyces sp. NPDC006274]|uniref:ankyrin repeat domain-containing protein n=1 Tax=Streptomyces sp. NPDC006274 TaxID=3154582 RepID=UPI00339FE822